MDTIDILLSIFEVAALMRVAGLAVLFAVVLAILKLLS